MAKREEATRSVAWNTPVPEALSDAATAAMTEGGFNSKAEYVRSLIRADVERREKVRLEARLPESAERLARVLTVLKKHRRELRKLGVLHTSVFGSTARGEAGPESDVDIAVEIDPKKKSLGIFEFAAIARRIEELVPNADVVDRKTLKPRVLARVVDEAVDAF